MDCLVGDTDHPTGEVEFAVVVIGVEYKDREEGESAVAFGLRDEGPIKF